MDLGCAHALKWKERNSMEGYKGLKKGIQASQEHYALKGDKKGAVLRVKGMCSKEDLVLQGKVQNKEGE